jgi:microcystin-dependent protein
MADPFMGELKMMSFDYAPKGWAPADGQLLPINQNPALFQLFGVVHGGDGQTSFKLPDLRGRVPRHTGPWEVLGRRYGSDTHALGHSEIPVHSHSIRASASNGNSAAPGGNLLARTPKNIYAGPPPSWGIRPPLHDGTVGSAGSGRPHENRQPYLNVNWCVAVAGVYPSRP